jgi:hypothetical protein
MIEHAWIAPKGFVKLTKAAVMVPWRICVSHLITHRAETVTGGRATFVIVAVSQRKQRRTASDLAVLSFVEPSAAQDFRGRRDLDG